MVPIEYGDAGLTIRQKIFAKHHTTHPKRKFPSREKRKLLTGRGEGNPPKPRQVQKKKAPSKSNSSAKGSKKKNHPHDSDDYSPSSEDSNDAPPLKRTRFASPSMPHDKSPSTIFTGFNFDNNSSIHMDSELEIADVLMDVDSFSELN